MANLSCDTISVGNAVLGHCRQRIFGYMHCQNWLTGMLYWVGSDLLFLPTAAKIHDTEYSSWYSAPHLKMKLSSPCRSQDVSSRISINLFELKFLPRAIVILSSTRIHVACASYGCVCGSVSSSAQKCAWESTIEWQWPKLLPRVRCCWDLNQRYNIP